MSGHAGFNFLEPRFEYSYSENSRKKIHTDRYEDYWAKKREHFDSVLVFSNSAFKKLDAEIEIAKLPLVPIDPCLPDTAPANIKIEIPGNIGNTLFRFQTKSELTESQMKTLKALVGPLEFSLLDSAWRKTDTSTSKYDTAKYDAAKSEELVRAVSVAKTYPKYALSIFLIREMRKEMVDEMRKKIENKMAHISSHIEKQMETKIADGKIWVNPKQLIAFEKKFGAEFKKKLNEQNPAKSVFNPYGPLRDDIGRRTSARAGMMVATILFLANDANWEVDTAFGKNTTEFEHWFQGIVENETK